jgi:type VI secretion system secreted protein VgrG
MIIQRGASEADFIFTASEYSEELRVLKFTGMEAISEPFRYKIKLASTDSGIDFDTIIGKTAYMSISGESGERYVHGIISRLVQSGTGNRYTIYNAELVPQIWLLGLRYNNRIFQNKTVEEIIRQIFDDASIQSDIYRFALQGNHPTREYCVQYRETDLNFISRLMEEEGIYYFFEHSEDNHIMVIGDDPSVHVAIDSPGVIYNPGSGMVQDRENIYAYNFFQQVRTSVVSLGDFNFVQPSLGSMPAMALSGEEAPDYENELEFYDYPGEYSEQSIGGDLAQIRLEAMRHNRKVGSGQSICRRLIPGYRFTLEGHPRSDFNQEYLIIRLTTSASQPLGEDMVGEGETYSNEFECIPYSVPFRPKRKAYKPIVEGVQTAMIVGPSGEEIYTDEYGRVKVQFHWDREGQRDENSSCWIRVSQGWAGPSWGMMFIPRIGQEVIVDFLEGDPDKPIITGRVYNGESMPPYTLPDDKTKSTIKSDSTLGGGGSNEIRFEDSKGNEEFYAHAQKDMNEKIENNMSTSVGANQSISVGGDRSVSVTGNQTINVKKNETIEVTGDRSRTVRGNDYIVVDGVHGTAIKGDTEIFITDGTYYHDVQTGTSTYHVTGKVTENYDDKQETTVNGDITIKSTTGKITVEAANQIELKTGASTISMKKDGTIEIKGVKIGIKGTSVAIDGSASVDIHGGMVTSKADASHNTQGAIVLSEGSATNTVKGGMVMLNP